MRPDLADLEHRLAAVLAGTAAPESITAWWDANEGTYRKPERPEAEWYLAQEDLSEMLSTALGDAITVPPGPGAVTVLKEMLPRLSGCGLTVAPQAWWLLGSGLEDQGRYAESAPVLQELATACPADSEDADLGCNALDLLVGCYRELGRPALARQALTDLQQRAETLGDDRFRAAALRHRARMLHAQAPGGEDPVVLAQRALDLRRSADEPRASPSRSVGSFFATLGGIARDRGQLDLALRTYTSWAEEAAGPGERARARSEIAFTHLRARRLELAAAELDTAASLMAAHDERLAARWRSQAGVFRGQEAGLGQLPALPRIATPSDAYHEASVVEMLQSRVTAETAAQGTAAEAGERDRTVAERAAAVLDWAQAHRDTDLELSMRHVLAAAARSAGDHKTARKQLRLAIDLADRRHRALRGLELRLQLAGAYSNLGRPQLAYETLWTALGPAETARNAAASSEESQQIAAVAAGIYEYLAVLAAAYGQPDVVVSASELLRARNLVRWLILDQAASASPAGAAALRDWRATEVEAEVRHLDGSLAGATLTALDQRRQAAIEAVAGAGIGARTPLWARAVPYATEILDGVASDDCCIVCFVASGPGVAAAVLPSGARPDEVHAVYLPWAAPDRRATVGAWLAATKEAARSRKGGRRSPADLQVDHDLLKSVRRELRTRVAEPLADLLASSPASTLVVVPHRELAAMPLWALVDPPLPQRAMTVVPSLYVWRCLARRRRRVGRELLLVGDTTGTLDHVPAELAAIRQVAHLPVVEALNHADLLAAAASAQLLHVAAHGVYDEAIPHRSGLLIEPADDTGYSASPLAGFADQDGHRYRMITTAELMTEVDLGACRLAVLSACESGVSRQHPAAELTGLPAALLLAGCEQVVASSWRVDDAAAAATAILLHRELAEPGSDGSAAAALSRARRKLVALSRPAALDLLGPGALLPPGEHPFAHPAHADAFSCYGPPHPTSGRNP
jgi:CHAT domain-containing protein